MIIRSFVGGKDVVAALPTGYGKSLCFACCHTFSTTKTRSIVIRVSDGPTAEVFTLCISDSLWGRGTTGNRSCQAGKKI